MSYGLKVPLNVAGMKHNRQYKTVQVIKYLNILKSIMYIIFVSKIHKLFIEAKVTNIVTILFVLIVKSFWSVLKIIL